VRIHPSCGSSQLQHHICWFIPGYVNSVLATLSPFHLPVQSRRKRNWSAWQIELPRFPSWKDWPTTKYFVAPDTFGCLYCYQPWRGGTFEFRRHEQIVPGIYRHPWGRTMNMSYWCVFNHDASKSQMKRFLIASNRYGGLTTIAFNILFWFLLPWSTICDSPKLPSWHSLHNVQYCSLRVRSAISYESPPNLSSSRDELADHPVRVHPESDINQHSVGVWYTGQKDFESLANNIGLHTMHWLGGFSRLSLEPRGTPIYIYVHRLKLKACPSRVNAAGSPPR